MPTIAKLAGIPAFDGIIHATFHWFGIVPAVVVAGIGLPALLALTYCLVDLDGRRGGRGWPTPKELRLLVGDAEQAKRTESDRQP